MHKSKLDFNKPINIGMTGISPNSIKVGPNQYDKRDFATYQKYDSIPITNKDAKVAAYQEHKDYIKAESLKKNPLPTINYREIIGQAREAYKQNNQGK